MVKGRIHAFYRMIAMVLCLAMVLPCVPAPTLAAEEKAAPETVYVLAASDFQGEWTDSAHNTANIAGNIQQILNKTGRTSYDGLLFLGDYNLSSDDGTVSGLPALKSALSGGSFQNQYYLQGNHDAVPTADNGLTATGGATIPPITACMR